VTDQGTRVAVAGTALWLLALAGLVAAVCVATGGQLVFTLDDPYIHLALAEGILQGAHGVNPGEWTSPSSSLLWPWLLVVTEALGLGAWGALAWNALAMGAAVYLLLGHAQATFGAGRLTVVLAPLLVVSLNALGLPLVGMEHSLHVLLSVVVVRSLTPTSPGIRAAAVAALLLPFVRPEGLALTGAWLAAIAVLGRPELAVRLGLVLVLGLGAAVGVQHLNGLPLVPTSVLLKSPIASGLFDDGIVGAVRGVAASGRSVAGSPWGPAFLVALVATGVEAVRSQDRERKVLAAVLAVLVGAHLVAGRFDWFHRYEVYAVAATVTGGITLWGPTLAAWVRRGPAARAALAVVALVLAVPYLDATVRTPAASRNIFEQHVQMHRFATEFFPEPVAVNDLGRVAYRNEQLVLDLAGVASEESRLHRRGGRTAAQVDALTSTRGVRYVMAYSEGLGEAVPPGWCRMATLETRQVTSARAAVQFYAADQEARAPLAQALDAFGPTLPAGVTFHRHDCASERRPVTATPEPPGSRLLLLAVDGFEWSVALPLLHAGQMPNLLRAMDAGSFGHLSTLQPTYSPLLWTSIATGKLAAKHGIAGFEHPDPDKALYDNTDRNTKAFWNILGDWGYRSAILGWFVTYPVEPIHGVMVAQTNTALRDHVRSGDGIRKGTLIPGASGQVYPPVLEADVWGAVSAAHARVPALLDEVFGTFDPPLDGELVERFQACEWAFRADATYAAIARDLLAPRDFDLMAVYVGGTDVVSHRFWAAPGPPDEERDGGSPASVVPDYYRYVDGLIGDLLASTGYENLLLVSDHGFDEGQHANGEPAAIVAAGPMFRDAELSPAALGVGDLPAVGSILDVAPTLLRLWGVPQGRDLDGRVLDGILAPAVLAKPEPPSVRSHDSAAWLRARPTARQPLVDVEERLEQLRALGYID